MSWQAAIIAGLVVVLALGFAWFERSRPDSRVVALVAALAALAVAGRLILTPFPNVVATTDIAFITGFSLGGAPGFAVGALAAPISNIWLGQGPWTVWQMAGWGMAGLAGAWLTRALGGRREEPNRWVLASACAAIGLLYGALLDLSVMVTYGGEQSLDRYLTLSARGIPFNVAHAAGNFAIAAAAGPAMVRMIARFRSRMEFRWHPAGALPLAALAAVVLGVAGTPPPDAHAGAIGSARHWLERARETNGGYSATPGSSTSLQMTSWAMLGLEAAGRNPRDVGRRTPVDYLASKRIRAANELELAILALEGAGVNSRSFHGENLVSALMAKQSGDGSWQSQVNLTAYGLLALRAAGESSGVDAAAAWLRSAQRGDGGWGFGPSQSSDPDSTGAAMQALGGGLGDAVGYLRRTQRGEGGWGLNETGVTNAQSTAWAVQGLVAAGVDPGRVRTNGHSGVSYLRKLQAADGSYQYRPGSAITPVWVTSQALLAVSRESLPIEPVARRESGGEPPAPSPDVDRGGDEPPLGDPSSGSGGGDGSLPPGVRHTGDGPRPGAGGGGTPDLGDIVPGGVARSGPEAAPGAEAAQGAEQEDDAQPGPETALADVLAADAGEATAAEADDHETTAWVVVGLGALALALGGGFLWYRRTLP